MNWKLVWRGMRVLYLLRIPFAALVLLAALGPLALWTSFSSLLGNLLDQSESGWSGTFLISIGAFLLGYAAVTTMNLILHYGRDRFPDNHVFPLGQKHPGSAFVAGTLAAAILMACVVGRTESSTKMPHIFGAILGLAVALALVVVSKIVQLKATDPKTTPHPPPYLVFPAYRFRPLEDYFDNLYCSYPERLRARKNKLNQLSQWPLEILRRAGQGYLVDITAPVGQLKLRSGHVFAFSLSILAFALYVIVGFDKSFITAEPARVPALAFVLLFLNVACWSLAALTFFFDRYRFPLLWTLAALAALTATAPQSDHFFRVRTDSPRKPFLTPGKYLRQRIEKTRDSSGKTNLVFVATPGGGIQAGAWTAKVLAELNNAQTSDQKPARGTFRDSVAFISSVSGGSLGSMIYAASFAGNEVPDPATNAVQSAIDEVAWGWTQPDFWRAVAPWFGRRTLDRGWALEEKWIAINHLGPKRLDLFEGILSPRMAEQDIFLWDWAAMGIKLPALVFNSMLVERGQHVVFSTTDYPAKDDKRGVINFYRLYPRIAIDVRVATAARLSASFPYVAPASRPEIDPYAPAFHFVDGGYYDNFGIDSLIGWLREATEGQGSDETFVREHIGDILILQIRHFDPSEAADPSQRGWFYQTHAPISGLLSMWNSAPASRDRNELELFRNTFDGDKHHIWFSSAKFRGSQKDCAPLSWKLSPRERACIVNAWNAARDEAYYCVAKYMTRSVEGTPPPSQCKELPQ